MSVIQRVGQCAPSARCCTEVILMPKEGMDSTCDYPYVPLCEVTTTEPGQNALAVSAVHTISVQAQLQESVSQFRTRLNNNVRLPREPHVCGPS
jgi:hypothetical protein